tara:strand:- start:921 stop:1940 length:1020 start_codon:yes stop_codon:yes gene_type:complete
MPGSQTDSHNCALDGGYSWCDETTSCIRPWETECNDINVDYCIDSPEQYCRMACDEPKCASNKCAMRTGNCCEYTCESNQEYIHQIDPLPLPVTIAPSGTEIPENCLSYFDGCNTCSVENGQLQACTLMYCFQQGTPECRQYSNIICNSDKDCSETQFCRLNQCVDFSGINERCGGFTLPEYQTRCNPSLECVNTMGPMIADAPGKCLELCKHDQARDGYGNCIEDNCNVWFDGCNQCRLDGSCTEMFCNPEQLSTPYCIEHIPVMPSVPPPVQKVPMQTHQLQMGDICYRFCEDNSESFINQRDNCPENTVCGQQTDNMVVSFDNCHENVFRCISVGH